MLSFLSSIKNDLVDCYYVFSNFSVQDINFILIICYQLSLIIDFLVKFSVIYVNYLNYILIYNYYVQNKYMIVDNQSISKDIS
jgi:hypothetical protein